MEGRFEKRPYGPSPLGIPAGRPQGGLPLGGEGEVCLQSDLGQAGLDRLFLPVAFYAND
jgi:hypothetical protein